MTRSRSPYLLDRDGAYFLRVRVPRGLVARVGVLEVRRSLGSSTFNQARLLALQFGTRLRRCFAMLLLHDVDAAACHKALQQIYWDLAAEVAGVRSPRGEDAWIFKQEQEGLSVEAEQRLRAQLSDGGNLGELERIAEPMLARQGISRSLLTPDHWDELVAGVARAMIEAQRRYHYQISDSILPYLPVDPLFAAPSGIVSGAQEEAVGPTLPEAIDAFCKASAPKWTPKTRKTHHAKLKLLIDCFGNERRISTITTPDLWSFIEAVQRLRRNYHTSSGQSFLSRQTDVVAARITAVTAINILARVKSLFRWAHQRGYCASNPADVIAVTQPKQKKGTRSRRPFTASELERFFSCPLFTGCATTTRRFDAGSLIIKDAHYWLPILGYYTGARLGELIQLEIGDVELGGEAQFISINEDGDQKHVKTEAGVRFVPLHPDLSKLGFAEFVASRRKSWAKGRLFREIKYGADGQASTVFSKWFGRALDKAGLEDPALVFHSFRHTAEDYLRASKLPKYVIDQLMGHRDQSAAGEYGVGVSVIDAHEIMAELKLPVRLPSFIGLNPLSGGVA